MKADTGESTASIRRRHDQANWPRVLEALRAGAHLTKPPKLDHYYVTFGDRPGGGSLSATYVRALEAKGLLQNVGVHRYALPAEGRAADRRPPDFSGAPSGASRASGDSVRTRK